jgi:hypothetical protein
VPSYFEYFGTVIGGTSPIATMLYAEPRPFCNETWDCNNGDKQDWKREAEYYYATYNGANYYRCGGLWGLSIAVLTILKCQEKLDDFDNFLCF